MAVVKTLFDIVQREAQNRPGSILLASKVGGAWQTITCKDAWFKSKKIAAALLETGIDNSDLQVEQQEKIAIISTNCPEWVIVDLAVQQTGSVLIPIYPTVSLNDFSFIIKEAEVGTIFFANQELLERFKPEFDNLPNLKNIYTFDEVKGYKNIHNLTPSGNGESRVQKISSEITTDTIATIIYTSGTTGKPKGVMLSHKNIVSNVLDCEEIFYFAKKDDKALSFLPLNHIFEKMITYIYMYSGVSIYYAESIDTIGANLLEVKPMVFTCVPRLLEKVYEKIYSKGNELTGIKRSLFFWALSLAMKYDNWEKGSLWYRMQLSIADKLVLSKWRAALGGNVKAIVSGSAPLQPKLIRIFSAAKLVVMEGYGLTETSPVIAVNRYESEGRKIGTVGPLIKNVSVKIAEDGEIICKGDNIMVGYYKNPEQTAEVLSKDGWFRTGDIGEFINDKFLKITDRKKEIFKTSGGKYVAPQPIENKLKESPYIEQVMVVGPNRKYVTALIVPKYEQIRKRLKDKFPDVQNATNSQLINEASVKQLIQNQIDRYNPNFSHVEQVKKFVLLPYEWTIDNGILTPKLSVKRKVVEEKFAQEISSMYDHLDSDL